MQHKTKGGRKQYRDAADGILLGKSSLHIDRVGRIAVQLGFFQVQGNEGRHRIQIRKIQVRLVHEQLHALWRRRF